MKKNRFRTLNAVRAFTTAVLAACLCLAAAGCSYFFQTRVDVRELKVDAADVLPYDLALDHVVETLNATQYGIPLDNAALTGKKIFDYNALFFRLKEHATRIRWTRTTAYSLELTNTCEAPENTAAGLDRYTTLFSVSPENLKTLPQALISLGVRPCTPRDDTW